MTKKAASSPQNYYQVGLGDSMLYRSRIIFLSLTVLVSVSLGYAILTGIKSGAIKRNIIDPTKHFVSAMLAESTASATPRAINTINLYTSTSSATIPNKPSAAPSTPKINTNTYSNTNSQPTQYQYNTKSYEETIKAQNAAAQKAWEDALKKQQEWSDQKRAENQNWFNTQSAKDAAQSKSWYDEQVQKMQQDTDAWKKAHGF